MLVSRPQALDTTGLATTEAVEAADNLRVRKGSRVADVSGLPEPTYTQLGMSYFVLDDGNGFPALATCVTSDADTYTWSLVPFGETVPALRTALDVYSRAQVDASDARNTQLVGALLSVALNVREMCYVRLDCASRSDTPLSEALPGEFTYSAGTLTAPINGDIREITGIGFELGMRFLWRFLSSNREHSGVFELSAFGSVSTKAAWTRSADFATSENFSEGAAVLTAGEQGSWQILRSTADESFVLDTDPAIFEIVNPAWLLAKGFSSLTAPSGGGDAPVGTALIADGSGQHQNTSAPVSALLAATSALEMRVPLDTYSTTEIDNADASVLSAAQTYVDNALQGFVPKGSVRVVLSATSLATLLGGCSYNSGTKRLTADNNGAIGTVDTVSDLEADQLIGVPMLTGSDARYNGPWRLVQLGDAGTPTIIQRATNFDSSSDVKASSYYLVEDGLDYGGSIFQLTTEGPYTLDTTELAWTRRRINLVLSDTTPTPLGSATPGTSGEASRRDHVHAMPSAADVGADVAGAAAAAQAAAVAASVPTSRTVAGVALSGDVSTAQIAAAVAAAPYSLSTTARLALSSPANGTRIYDSTVDREFVRRGGLWIRDDGALLFGTQPGGDTSWPGVTLTNGPAGCSTAVTSGSVRWTQPANTAVLGGGTAALQISLAGIAASLACRVEWRLVPISGWSAVSDLSYGGLIQAAYAKYMMHRCLGTRLISPWNDRYAAGGDRQPGPQIAGVGPDASNTQVWMALHCVGHRVAYQYGVGSAGAPPVPSAWTTYAVYDLLADDSITSTNTVSNQPVGDSLFSLNLEGTVGAGSARVVDLSALTIYPIGGWR